MKARYPCSEGLITLEESHFHVGKLSSSGWREDISLGVEDLTTGQESLFQAAKMPKTCSTGTMYSSTKSLIPVEEPNFHVTKRPNRGFVDGRYLWADGLIAFSGSQNAIIVSTGSRVPFSSGSHNSSGLALSGHQKVQYGPPRAEVLRKLEESHFQAFKMPTSQSTIE
jgi:hypothetical protein